MKWISIDIEPNNRFCATIVVMHGCCVEEILHNRTSFMNELNLQHELIKIFNDKKINRNGKIFIGFNREDGNVRNLVSAFGFPSKEIKVIEDVRFRNIRSINF